ncbi:unnamed protein product, partial [Ilex paraguariensis]
MEVVDAIESLWRLFLVALGLGALLMLMARTKSTDPGASPSPSGSTSKKRVDEDPSSQDKAERRTKARHDARKQCIEEKGVMCERYVDRVLLGPSNEV